MSNKKIKYLQHKLTRQTSELDSIHEKLAQRSYKLSESALQDLYYQEAYLQEQVDNTQAQLSRLKLCDKPTKKICLKLVMTIAVSVAILLDLLLRFFL